MQTRLKWVASLQCARSSKILPAFRNVRRLGYLENEIGVGENGVLFHNVDCTEFGPPQERTPRCQLTSLPTLFPLCLPWQA